MKKDKSEKKAYVRTFDLSRDELLNKIEKSCPKEKDDLIIEKGMKMEIEGSDVGKEFRTMLEITNIENERISFYLEYDYIVDRKERGEIVVSRATKEVDLVARFDTENDPLFFFYGSQNQLKGGFTKVSKILFDKQRQLSVFEPTHDLIVWVLEEHDVDKIRESSVHPDIPGLNSKHFKGTFSPQSQEFEKMKSEGDLYSIKYHLGETDFERLIKIGSFGFYKIEGEECTKKQLEDLVIFLYDKNEEIN